VQILAVDIGKGTQDILYADEATNPENWIKAVLPSPTVKLAEKVKRMHEDVRADGYVMGGGPLKKALVEHIAKGYRVFVSERAVRTIRDDIAQVREMGITVLKTVERPNLYLSDLEFSVYETLLEMAGREFTPSAVAIACQDHGFVKGQKDRVTRFKYFEEKLSETRDPHHFIVTKKTTFFSRFDSVLEQIKERSCAGFVMDSKIASVCGILLYAEELKVKEFIGLDIGNGHTLGVSIKNGTVCGIFEHHTRHLTEEKLRHLIRKLADKTITFEEVFEDGGHGALALERIDPEKVLITGPNRKAFKGVGEYAYPGGDVMMTGCMGLYVTARKFLSGEIPLS